jgi:hypothetical protein
MEVPKRDKVPVPVRSPRATPLAITSSIISRYCTGRASGTGKQ